ncbi:MAG: YfhO family protein [Tannerella sp.]|jgi:hypothetical protein|nr:YfhO family protein [Tannerella sp.]
MKLKEIIVKFLPHILAVALFLLLTTVYFYPVLEGKDLVQGDITSGSGWGRDANEAVKQTGEYTFWSNAMFGGMPGNYTGGMPPIYNVFAYLGNIFIFNLSILHIGLVFIYMLGFYIFLLSLGCKPWLGVIGAVAYAFASYNLVIIEAGHANKALVMATMAPVLGGIIMTYRGKYLLGALVTLIFTGINVMWGHQQISYYLLIMIAILAIVYLIYAIREHTLKKFFTASGILVAVAALAILPEAGKLISTADYTKESMRGGAVLQSKTDGEKASSGLDKDYAYMWSYGRGETMTLLIPNFCGAASYYNIGKDSETYRVLKPTGQADQFVKYAPMYWGGDRYKSFTSGPVYVGAIICLLFLFGLQIVKGREKWWLLTATIVSIILAWGRHFALVNDFLFYYLPMYNKFRTPEMALVIAEVTMATLGILAVKQFLETEDKRLLIKPLWISAGITGGLCLLFAVLGGGLMSFSALSDQNYSNYPELLGALVTDRKNMLTSDSWRSLMFIAGAAAALWFYIRKPYRTTYLFAILGVLIFIDLWTVDKRFINYDSFVPQKKAKEIVPTEADNQILQDKDPNYRVLNLASNTFQESNTSYFHKSIGGYSPAKLRRYQDIIDYHFSGQLNMNVLNMLNTRYVIVQGNQVQRNPEALGNCWFVDSIRWVNSPDEEIVALNNFDPAHTAVIDVEWKDKLPADIQQYSLLDSTAHIVMTNYYTPGHIYYESQSTKAQLAVFSEVFYKTWRAYIDGQEATPIRVNYILRGLPVPAGEHQIEFRCIDEVYLRGARISLAASWIIGFVIIGLAGMTIWSAVKPRRKAE